MTIDIPPGLLLIGAGLLLPLVPARMRPACLLLAPAAEFAHLLSLAPGMTLRSEVFGFVLEWVRVDRLSLAFGYVFVIASLLYAVFAWHLRSRLEPSAAMVYAGAAMAAVFAGDLLTLFLYWELTAIAAVLVIWAHGSEHAFQAGFRYIVVQLASGMLLAAGAALLYAETGSLAFGAIGVDQPGGVLLLLAFGIKCAFPFLHNWLQDAYPEATATGTVVLSAFTTKLGIYALARGFPGTEMLIWIGTAMAAFPIFYAVIENDLRRVLAYSMNNQLGFMVVGVGVGTELSLNGTVAHAFADILFKGLLFMSMGAVLFRTGTVNGTNLGGLYKSMPWTTGFCIIGAASISAFPLFSGFVTKSLIMTAVAGDGRIVEWLILLFASAGVFHHAGIKIPYFAFFAHDAGIRCREAPANMLIAMGIAAALCIGIGVLPDLFYSILPFAVAYEPYTASHVLAQLQLLIFSALAFAVLMRTGIYPPELRSVNLDFDWLYRRAALRAVRRTTAFASAGIQQFGTTVGHAATWVLAQGERRTSTGQFMADGGSTRGMALWVMVMLVSYLVMYYV